MAWRWHAHFYFGRNAVVLGHYLCRLYFFRDFSRALMHTPSPSIEAPFTATYTKNSFLLCVHCLFKKKQMSELKIVNGVIFFFFSSKHFRISIMKNCRKLFTSLYGMNRKWSERLFWSLFLFFFSDYFFFTHPSFLPFSFLVLRWLIVKILILLKYIVGLQCCVC